MLVELKPQATFSDGPACEKKFVRSALRKIIISYNRIPGTVNKQIALYIAITTIIIIT